MIFHYDDQVAGATLSGSGFETTLPVANVAVNPVSKVARVVGTSMSIDVDAGASVTWRVLGLVGTNLSASATVRVLLSDVQAGDSDVLDTGTGAAGATARFPQVYVDLGADYSARYARVTVADATLSFIDVGRLFGGPAWIPARNYQRGARVAFNDLSGKSRTPGGQLLTAEDGRFRSLSFALRFNTEAEMIASAVPLLVDQGLTGDVLAMLRPDDYPQEMSVYGPLASAPALEFWAHGRVAMRVTIEERL